MSVTFREHESRSFLIEFESPLARQLLCETRFFGGVSVLKMTMELLIQGPRYLTLVLVQSYQVAHHVLVPSSQWPTSIQNASCLVSLLRD